MQIIFGNYGNNTIALIQWAHEQNIQHVHVLNVTTGWAAIRWQLQVEQGKQLATSYGFTVVTLTPKYNFPELVRDRGGFPSQKFQWCAGFLKGLPFIEWADLNDPLGEAIILLGSRRADSQLRKSLPDFIEHSEHYGYRTVHYPLVDFTDEARNTLILRAGFKILNHRSLECDPCIHADINSLSNMEHQSLERLSNLENEMNQNMFAQPITHFQKRNQESENLCILDMGCGSHFACGE
jgi:hypothetical protein